MKIQGSSIFTLDSVMRGKPELKPEVKALVLKLKEFGVSEISLSTRGEG